MTTKKKKAANVPNLRFPGFERIWIQRNLGEICSMQAGKFISASEIKQSSQTGLFPCYGGNGLRGYVKSFNQAGEYPLIGRQGALCGNVMLAKGKFHATEHAVVVKSNEDVDTSWLYYLLIRLNLNQYATGAAQPGLSVQNLEQVEFRMPESEKEQKKISSFLAMIDERIQTQNKIIEQLESLIKGMRDKLLSQEIRFNDDLKNSFPDWEEKKLDEVCEKRASNISANKIEDSLGNYIIYGASGILHGVSFYEEEDDYIGIVKDGAGVGRLFYCKGKSSVLGTMDIIKPANCMNTYFLFHVLTTIDFTQYITGSTIPHIYFKDYKNEICNIPSIEEQSKIVKFLFSIDEKIKIESSLLKKLEVQKKFLLAELFI